MGAFGGLRQLKEDPRAPRHTLSPFTSRKWMQVSCTCAASLLKVPLSHAASLPKVTLAVTTDSWGGQLAMGTCRPASRPPQTLAANGLFVYGVHAAAYMSSVNVALVFPQDPFFSPIMIASPVPEHASRAYKSAL